MLRAALGGHNSIIELLVDQYHCSLTDTDNVSALDVLQCSHAPLCLVGLMLVPIPLENLFFLFTCHNLRASLLCTSNAVSVVLASVAVDGMKKESVLTEWWLYPGPGANFMTKGQYNVHTYMHILCGETHREMCMV